MKKLCTSLALIVALLGLPLTSSHAAGGATGTTGLATGDFDDDGHDDLAVGVPREDVGPEGSEIENAGLVQVIYASNNGLRSGGNQVWHQDRLGIAGVVEANDNFGTSVVAGDFDGDGFDDLAIGSPGEGVGVDASNDQGTGAVHILFGGSNGLSAAGDELWHQDTPGVKQTAEDSDQFGRSLAAGNFGRSGNDDLAIGAPLESFGDPTLSQAGIVQVLYGSNEGLTARRDQVWHQDVGDVNGVAGSSELFGFSLAAADFGRNAKDDLAIGVTRDSSGAVNSVLAAGTVNVLYGSPNGLRVKGDQRWAQDSANIEGESEKEDGFGWSLTAANFGRKSFADLAVGAPFEDVGPADNAGSVNIIYGSRRGLRARGNQYWTRATPGIMEAPEEFSNFGNTLAAADLGKGQTADLAVGAPFDDVSSDSNGQVHVIYGTKRGLTARGDQSWTQDSTGVNDASQPSDYFGGSMAAGDFGRNGRGDLAIGAPGEDLSAGAVNVLYAKQGGLSSADDQFWQQGLGLKEVAEDQDGFAAGQYD